MLFKEKVYGRRMPDEDRHKSSPLAYGSDELKPGVCLHVPASNMQLYL